MDIYVGCEYTVFFFLLAKNHQMAMLPLISGENSPFSQKELAKLLTTLLSMSQPVCLLPTILMIPYKSVAS
jgi:hypothetical protein